MIEGDDAPAQQIKPFDAIHARPLAQFFELVDELGGDAGHMVARVGGDPGRVAGEGTAPYSQLIPLLELAAAELDCPDFAMRLAKRQGAAVDTMRLVGVGMRSAPTLGDAIDLVVRHSYAHSRAVAIWSKWLARPDRLAVGHTLLLGCPLICAQAVEQIFLHGQLLALELTAGEGRARCIMFRHQPVAPPSVYARFFKCDVQFGQHADAAIYDVRALACPIASSDPLVYARTLGALTENSPSESSLLRSRAKVTVNHYLGTEFCTRVNVAERLNLHPRTMDRRLNAEGTSFLEIRDDVRRELLRYYVENTGFPFTIISERLGFSEQSVMTKNCRKWFALTPTQMRTQRAAAPTQSRPSGSCDLRIAG